MDMKTMGDSSKRSDESKIGKFDSGLKYALSILKRNNIDFDICSGGIKYTFDTTVLHDDATGKTKEVLEIVTSKTVNKGEIETREPSAFALNLGHEWKFWMAIRELYSNCLDEGGQVFFCEHGQTPVTSQYDTVIRLGGCELIQSIIDDWGRYFNTGNEPLYDLGSVKLYPNKPDGELRVYKSGILVYEDKDTTSRYVYDYPHADIDEMRRMTSTLNFGWSLENSVCRSSDKLFIQDFMSSTAGEFEQGLDFSNRLSDTWVEHVNSVYKETGSIDAYKTLLSNFKSDVRIDVGVRSIATRETSYSKRHVEVYTPVKDEKVVLSFEEKVQKICLDCGFSLSLPVVISSIDGMKCVGDVNKKVIYVNDDFSESDVWEIVRAQYRVLHRNDQDQIFKDFVKHLKS